MCVTKTMKLPLLLAALLAVTASADSGDWLQLNLASGHRDYDQVRILTQPRAGYSAATDHINVFHPDGYCDEEGALLGGDDVPTEYNECCKISSLEGFKVWPEKQDVNVPNSFYVDYKYTGGSSCGKVEEHASYPTLMSAGTYNSYMVQHYETGGIEAHDRVLQFPK
jgi:hypothetical protein